MPLPYRFRIRGLFRNKAIKSDTMSLTEPFPDFDPTYGIESLDLQDTPQFPSAQATPTPEQERADQFEVETGMRFANANQPQTESRITSSQVSPTSLGDMYSSIPQDKASSIALPSPIESAKSGTDDKLELHEHNTTTVPVSLTSSFSGAEVKALIEGVSSTNSEGSSIGPDKLIEMENAFRSSTSVPVGTSRTPLHSRIDGGQGVDGGSDTLKTLTNPLMPTFSTPIKATKAKSVADSSVSENKYLVGNASDRCWDNVSLRGLTDIVRECIEQIPVPLAQAEELSVVLTTLTQDIYSMTIYDIIDSHMDRLLECMVKHATSIQGNHTMGLAGTCNKLIHIWEKMFESKWASIDAIRLSDMLGGTVKDLLSDTEPPQVIGEIQQGGMLRGMSMTVNADGAAPVFSTPITTLSATRSQTEGTATFSSGAWWPNKAAAARDGIITAHLTNVTMNPLYGPTALVLLRGEEVQGPELNMTQYSVVETKEEKDMIHFLTRKGPFRVIRGYKLKSPYAPKAGFRYDGLYERYQFGLKTDTTENCNRYTLILKRLDHQTPMAALLQVPRPHQLDEWRVYGQWVASEMQTQAGQVKYAVWRLSEEQQRREKEDWEHERAVDSSRFRKYTTDPRKASYRHE